MSRRFEITDQEWERLAPLLPPMTPKRGGRWRDHRQVLNGILFRVRSGVPWRDLPERYGPWETVYKRFARWQTEGTWARIEAALRVQADAAGELDRDAQIDASVVGPTRPTVGRGRVVGTKRGTPRTGAVTSGNVRGSRGRRARWRAVPPWRLPQ